MKILVLSDSHGNVGLMRNLFSLDNYRAVIFLGDVVRDADQLARYTGAVPVYKVRGNCDFFGCTAYETQFIEIEGKKIFMAHGHTYSVKGGIGAFTTAARKIGADIALFGHTHIQYYNLSDGMHILNPGAIANGKYAEITIQNNNTSIELRNIND